MMALLRGLGCERGVPGLSQEAGIAKVCSLFSLPAPRHGMGGMDKLSKDNPLHYCGCLLE